MYQSDIIGSSYDYLYKVILLGDSGVGKSNILSRFVVNNFDPKIKSTIGVEFVTKNVDLGNTTIKLQIWDTAGQEKYRSLTSAYYRGTAGAVLIYDITNYDTFTNLNKWITEIKENMVDNIKIILVGNKSDLINQREIGFLDAKQFADKYGMQYIESSALAPNNIDKIFYVLAEQIYKINMKNHEINDHFDENININDEKKIKTCKCSI